MVCLVGAPRSQMTLEVLLVPSPNTVCAPNHTTTTITTTTTTATRRHCRDRCRHLCCRPPTASVLRFQPQAQPTTVTRRPPPPSHPTPPTTARDPTTRSNYEIQLRDPTTKSNYEIQLRDRCLCLTSCHLRPFPSPCRALIQLRDCCLHFTSCFLPRFQFPLPRPDPTTRSLPPLYLFGSLPPLYLLLQSSLPIPPAAPRSNYEIAALLPPPYLLPFSLLPITQSRPDPTTRLLPCCRRLTSCRPRCFLSRPASYNE
jgi:hypothetical protein